MNDKTEKESTLTSYQMLLLFKKDGLQVNKMSQLQGLAKARGYEWNSSWSVWENLMQ